MNLGEIVGTYGYAALVVGTFLEGETILVLGGFAAHLGYLSLPKVILAAFAGTFAGDQLFFFLGRRYGKAFLRRRPKWASRAERAQRLVNRYSSAVAVGFRFVYGMRTVTPFVLGQSSIGTARFVCLNMIGGAAWAAAIATVGYLFGKAAEMVLRDVQRYELELMAAILLAGAVVWIWRGVRGKRDGKENNADRR